uniref:Uncharacterized protein n=1 Tax=Steinernema glaseri TaxID=37863 RepID=A0A1I8AVD3_9BILA
MISSTMIGTRDISPLATTTRTRTGPTSTRTTIQTTTGTLSPCPTTPGKFLDEWFLRSQVPAQIRLPLLQLLLRTPVQPVPVVPSELRTGQKLLVGARSLLLSLLLYSPLLRLALRLIPTLINRL